MRFVLRLLGLAPRQEMAKVADVDFAHYPPRPTATRLQLHDGPLDGWEVGVDGPPPPTVRINGPRHGNHNIWVTHTYVVRAGRYEYVSTTEDDIGTFGWRHLPRA